jgi:hypothetical protein
LSPSPSGHDRGPEGGSHENELPCPAGRGLLIGIGSSANAGVDVHVAIPAPPSIVIEAPPRVIVVPGVPTVQYAPDVSYDYFVYGGRYYTYHSSHWFVSDAYGGPWTYVERVHVPRPILGVPDRYYHHSRSRHARRGHPHGMPPGQAKKIYGHDHGHDHHDHD